MMLAYRRGLLEPGYKYGLQSRIREKMILEMLAMEQNAAALENALLMQCTAVAPAVDPAKALDFASGFFDRVTKAARLKEYDNSEVDNTAIKETEVARDSANLVKAFNMLKERGIIEEFRKAAAKVAAEYQDEEF